MGDGTRWKDIVFLNGYPMWADGGGTHNRMGTMLLEEGTISQEQYAVAVQCMRDEGTDFGSALTDNGILSATELYRQLRRLVERRVVSGHAWAVGSWTLSSVFPKQASCFEVQPLRAVWRGIRAHGDLAAMHESVNSHDADYVIPTARYHADWTVLKGEEAFASLGSFLNGMRTVRQLRELEVLADEEFTCALWLMFEAGMVGFAARPAQSARLSSSAGGAQTLPTLRSDTIPSDLSAEGELILYDYLRLWQADFFSLFGVSMKDDEEEIQRALSTSPVSWQIDELDEALPGDIRAKAKALMAWIEEGRSTLSSSDGREAYRTRLELGSTGTYRTVSAPDSTEAAMFFENGKGFVRLHNYVEAEKSFGRAVDADPATPEYLAYRAWAGYRRDGGSVSAVQEARRLLSEALEADTHQPMAHYFVGLIHRDQKEFSAALEAFQQAVRFDPGFEPARMALEQVEELAGALH